MTTRSVAGLAALCTLLAGCSGGAGVESGDAGATVFAAASLSGVFERIAQNRPDPVPRVSFSFAGSSDLVAQLASGAPADVLATADEATMRRAVAEGVVSSERVRTFATNTLVAVTPPNDPGRVSSVADLQRDGVSLVVCAPQVPCGATARAVLGRSSITVRPVSEEASVADVLGKVTSGQADVGLVYVTDARRAGDAVRTVEVPQARDLPTRYAIAVTRAAEADPRRREAAEAFVGAVLDPDGRRVLTEAGFGPAPR